MPIFSVLDQGPVRHDIGPRQALCDSLTLAKALDRLGYARMWVAEHHGTASRAIAAPEILIGRLASVTERLRVGAGGIMLPNHAPLHVVEQFRTLEALFPGRIDLGIGRATGANNDVTAAALRREPETRDSFDRQLALVLAFAGLGPFPAGAPAEIRVMPDDVALPPVVLLGASTSSAEAAARLGLPYALSAGFRDPALAVAALRRYRAAFEGDRPHAILVLRVWVGEDDAHGEAIAASERLANVQQLAGDPQPLRPAEQALAHRYSAAERRIADPLDLRSDLAGGPELVRTRLAELADAAGADEVMVVSNTYDPNDRIASCRRLAAVVGLTAPVAA
ncbi:MsnO8 family LLM class oxidoreductase [Kutzneria buriramensis]|uniref:Luciferase family oxidoreductase group 1 n=1 Tax=Kutzneria buriramensis TaxID=1045776 RepID=A0A3E0GTU3_9PSEU|nr:MsnO8 family LLM class oxidoreductase [Kutzneria buriramensis]REH27621.1 luciferase family oxidoreductase group 1 [Kutzneria buriramensis]